MGNVEHTPEERAEIKRRYAEYCKQHEAEWKAEERRRNRRDMGFIDADSDCSIVQFYRMSDCNLSSSTQFEPIFDEKCPVAFSRYCTHCKMFHNFIAVPSILAHFCTVHNRRHETKEDLEQVVAEAEQRHIQIVKKARGEA
jgi:hypothetical protein